MFDGQILKRIRDEEGLTQEEFASILDVTDAYICFLETGQRQPSLKFLQKVGRIFHCKFKITCQRTTSKVII